MRQQQALLVLGDSSYSEGRLSSLIREAQKLKARTEQLSQKYRREGNEDASADLIQINKEVTEGMLQPLTQIRSTAKRLDECTRNRQAPNYSEKKLTESFLGEFTTRFRAVADCEQAFDGSESIKRQLKSAYEGLGRFQQALSQNQRRAFEKDLLGHSHEVSPKELAQFRDAFVDETETLLYTQYYQVLAMYGEEFPKSLDGDLEKGVRKYFPTHYLGVHNSKKQNYLGRVSARPEIQAAFRHAAETRQGPEAVQKNRALLFSQAAHDLNQVHQNFEPYVNSIPALSGTYRLQRGDWARTRIKPSVDPRLVYVGHSYGESAQLVQNAFRGKSPPPSVTKRNPVERMLNGTRFAGVDIHSGQMGAARQAVQGFSQGDFESLKLILYGRYGVWSPEWGSRPDSARFPPRQMSSEQASQYLLEEVKELYGGLQHETGLPAFSYEQAARSILNQLDQQAQEQGWTTKPALPAREAARGVEQALLEVDVVSLGQNEAVPLLELPRRKAARHQSRLSTARQRLGNTFFVLPKDPKKRQSWVTRGLSQREIESEHTQEVFSAGLKDYFQSVRKLMGRLDETRQLEDPKEAIKRLIRTSPGQLPAILARYPQFAPMVCDWVDEIEADIQEDQDKDQWLMTAGLVLAAGALLLVPGGQAGGLALLVGAAGMGVGAVQAHHDYSVAQEKALELQELELYQTAMGQKIDLETYRRLREEADERRFQAALNGGLSVVGGVASLRSAPAGARYLAQTRPGALATRGTSWLRGNLASYGRNILGAGEEAYRPGVRLFLYRTPKLPRASSPLRTLWSNIIDIPPNKLVHFSEDALSGVEKTLFAKLRGRFDSVSDAAEALLPQRGKANAILQLTDEEWGALQALSKNRLAWKDRLFKLIQLGDIEDIPWLFLEGGWKSLGKNYNLTVPSRILLSIPTVEVARQKFLDDLESTTGTINAYQPEIESDPRYADLKEKKGKLTELQIAQKAQARDRLRSTLISSFAFEFQRGDLSLVEKQELNQKMLTVQNEKFIFEDFLFHPGYFASPQFKEHPFFEVSKDTPMLFKDPEKTYEYLKRNYEQVVFEERVARWFPTEKTVREPPTDPMFLEEYQSEPFVQAVVTLWTNSEISTYELKKALSKERKRRLMTGLYTDVLEAKPRTGINLEEKMEAGKAKLILEAMENSKGK